jgi:small subunit ribosomal protein S11
MGEKKVKTIDAGVESKSDTTEAVATPKKRGKKSKVQVKRVRIYIQSTYNNTIITITDLNGNVIGWGAAGKTGFKGSRKSTPYAAQRTMEEVLERLKGVGIQEADVVVKGVGIGRESAIRALITSGIEVLSIRDRTPIAHGGVRPKKPRHP